MNWKIGQKLVCINSDCFLDKAIDPKKGDIVTFDGLSPYGHGSIFLKEHNRVRVTARVAFMPQHFRPIDDTVTYDDLYEKFGSPERLDSPLKPTVKIPQTA